MATYPVGGEWVFKDSSVIARHGSVGFLFVDAAENGVYLGFRRTPKRCKLIECTIYSRTGHTLVEMDKDDRRLKTFGIDKVVEQCTPLVFLMT